MQLPQLPTGLRAKDVVARRFARLRRLAVDLYREEPLRGKTGSVLDQSSRSQVRHFQVADIPRTKRGKIVELAVRQAVHNEQIRNTEALANPEVLEQFRHRAELARVSAVNAPRHRALYSQAG